jgi:hypothetical protein
MAPNSLSKNRRSNISYDDPDNDDGVSSSSSSSSPPLPKSLCLGSNSSDIGAVLESLPRVEDEQQPACLAAADSCNNSVATSHGDDGSMNSSFCIWDKLNSAEAQPDEVETETTVDALSAVAADGRPMFYQFQDEHEKSISNRSRTCFDGDSKHSSRSSYEHSNRTTRVRTIEMEDFTTTTKNKKCVQFAENIDGSVKSTTHTYPKAVSLMVAPNHTVADLWWSSDEWVIIKKKIRKAVYHYKMHARETRYSEAIRGLMYSYRKSSSTSGSAGNSNSNSNSNIKEHMATLLQCSDARGLESYIVGHSKALTDAHLDAVLKAQHDALMQGLLEDNPDKAMEEIRKAAKKSSRPARQLALKLAESDKYQALRATLSSWKTP